MNSKVRWGYYEDMSLAHYQFLQALLIGDPSGNYLDWLVELKEEYDIWNSEPWLVNVWCEACGAGKAFLLKQLGAPELWELYEMQAYLRDTRSRNKAYERERNELFEKIEEAWKNYPFVEVCKLLQTAYDKAHADVVS